MTNNILGETDNLVPNFNPIINSNVAGVSWVLGTIIVVLSLAFITRSPSKWKRLALPMVMGWHMLGVSNSFVIIVIAAIVYITDALTFSAGDNPLTIFTKPVKFWGERRDKLQAQENKHIEKLNRQLLKRRHKKDRFGNPMGTRYSNIQKVEDMYKNIDMQNILSLKTYGGKATSTRINAYLDSKYNPVATSKKQLFSFLDKPINYNTDTSKSIVAQTINNTKKYEINPVANLPDAAELKKRIKKLQENIK